MNVVYFVADSPDYIELCQLSINTVRKACPEASIHLYTNVVDALEGVTVHYHDGPYPNPLMLQNTLVWRDFCAEHTGTTVFLDPDVLMISKPDLTYLHDLAFTWRINVGDFGERMPWNTGVVFARNNASSVAFFDAMVKHIRQNTDDHQKWFGNQLALADLLGKPDPHIVNAWQHQRQVWWSHREVCVALVSELPCDRYNWTPEGDEPLMDRYFVHLKGLRKHRMKPIHDQLVNR